MAEEPFNDNDMPAAVDRNLPSDAPGQAALLLVESLLHSLIEKTVFSAAEGVEIVLQAAEVQEEIDYDTGGMTADKRRSHSLLQALAISLGRDAI